MSYSSEIVIAISGTPEQIKQYVDHVSTLPIEDEEQLLSLFKIIDVRKDLSLFLFYQDDFCWHEKEDAIWKILREQAIKAELSYIFYRLGGNYDDAEVEEHEGNDDHCLCDSLNLHRRIIIDDEIAAKYNC